MTELRCAPAQGPCLLPIHHFASNSPSPRQYRLLSAFLHVPPIHMYLPSLLLQPTPPRDSVQPKEYSVQPKESNSPPGKSCLFANTINKQSRISLSDRIRSSSWRASSIRSRSAESITKISPCMVSPSLSSANTSRKTQLRGYGSDSLVCRCSNVSIMAGSCPVPQHPAASAAHFDIVVETVLPRRQRLFRQV
jgi:hypothetical protein